MTHGEFCWGYEKMSVLIVGDMVIMYDFPLASIAKRDQAECLVTDDKDLLELSERYPIMSVE